MKPRNLLPLFGVALLAACGNEAENAPVVDAAEADEPAVTAPDAAPAPEAVPVRQVLSESLPYGEVNSELVYGHFAFPADMVEPLPAVVMIHERWGLDDTVRAQANSLAAKGYIVLVVDLLNGRTTADGLASNKLMQDVLESPDETLENIRQALDFVRSAAGAPTVAVLGSDLGGEWALKAAYRLPDMIDAAVTVYGSVTSDQEQLATLQAPVLGLFGGKDGVILIETVRSFEEAMIALGKEHVIHVYPKAEHYFLNPSRENRFRPGAAQDAWQRTHVFLAEHLSDPDD